MTATPVQKTCPACSAVNDLPAAFCVKCGHKFSTQFQNSPNPNQTQSVPNPAQAIPKQAPLNATQMVVTTPKSASNPFSQPEYWLPKAIHSGLWTVGLLIFFFGTYSSIAFAILMPSDGSPLEKFSVMTEIGMVIGTFAATLICIGIAETLRFTVYYYAKK